MRNSHVAEPLRSILNAAASGGTAEDLETRIIRASIGEYGVPTQDHPKPIQTVDGDPVDYSTRPIAHRASMSLWIKKGLDPGTGLSLVLAHDLAAVCYCDESTVAELPALFRWLHNHAPWLCHGSRERVEAWGKARRAER